MKPFSPHDAMMADAYHLLMDDDEDEWGVSLSIELTMPPVLILILYYTTYLYFICFLCLLIGAGHVFFRLLVHISETLEHIFVF